MNIQAAIKSGKPFRREGWVDEIYVVYARHDIVLSLETDFSTSIELDVQDILADDWYTRDGSSAQFEPDTDGLTQPMRNTQTRHQPVNQGLLVTKLSNSFSMLMTQNRQ